MELLNEMQYSTVVKLRRMKHAGHIARTGTCKDECTVCRVSDRGTDAEGSVDRSVVVTGLT